MLPALLRSLGGAVLWSCLLLISLPARAQESSAAYASAMTGPLERVEACFKDLGVVQMPNMLRREAIEKSFPMIGPEGLRGTGSLGMRMGPSEPGSPRPTAVLLFPISRK